MVLGPDIIEEKFHILFFKRKILILILVLIFENQTQIWSGSKYSGLEPTINH
jgi:hypothetical protein